jgi:hypothetical protein
MDSSVDLDGLLEMYSERLVGLVLDKMAASQSSKQAAPGVDLRQPGAE